MMQYLEGVTLLARLRRDGAFAVDVYARDIVTALAAAHAQKTKRKKAPARKVAQKK